MTGVQVYKVFNETKGTEYLVRTGIGEEPEDVLINETVECQPGDKYSSYLELDDTQKVARQ